MNPADRPPSNNGAQPPLERREGDATPVVDMHEPIYREYAEPRDGFEPPPTWLLFFCLALMGFGGWYLGTFSGGFDPAVYDERGWMRGGVPATLTVAAELDPMVLGKRVYNNCMACHQRDGSGLAGNYPPLDGSEWVTGQPEVVAALVLHGIQGPLEVDGKLYNQVMPKWSHLTDDQIAAVLTYVRASWSNNASPVVPDMVATVRETTADRLQPWTREDLEIFASALIGGASDEDETRG